MNFFLLTPSSFSMFFMISFTIRAYPIIRANTGFLLASNFVHDMMSMSIVCLKMVTYKNENYVSHSATTLLGLSCKEYTSLHKKLPSSDSQAPECMWPLVSTELKNMVIELFLILILLHLGPNFNLGL